MSGGERQLKQFSTYQEKFMHLTHNYAFAHRGRRDIVFADPRHITLEVGMSFLGGAVQTSFANGGVRCI